MPPKKAKQSGNGFYYFMLEFKNKQGRNFSSMNEVAQAAGPHWSNMSKEERSPYEARAQMGKSAKGGRLTSEGIEVDELERIERLEQKKIQEMKEEINQEMKMAGRTGRLNEKMFFFIHINTFCFCPPENRHYPAEIAILGLTLESGVLPENVFHRMIKPGLLPLGFAGIAGLHSKETHEIQPPVTDEENNIEDVYIEMKLFLQSKMEGSQRMPILYCEEQHVKMIQMILDTWKRDYDNGRALFKVFNLQYMFRILRNTIAEDNVWPSDTFSNRELEKDMYAYAKGVCCEYHSQTNVSLFCSRSVVIRQAFTVCDNCCPDLNIPFVPGCHVPNTAFMGGDMSRPSSVASSRSSRSRGNMGSSVRDDDSGSVISISSKSEWENQSVTSETSSSHAIHDEDDFPSLGQTKRKDVLSPSSWNRFSPSDSSSLFSQSSTRSYAGAAGTSGLSRRPADMPSSVMNVEKLSLDSVKSPETFSVGRGTSRSFDDVGNFPSLTRGRGTRGPRGRGLRRPNSDM